MSCPYARADETTSTLVGLLVCMLGSCASMPVEAQNREDLFKQVFGKKSETERSISVELEVDGYARPSSCQDRWQAFARRRSRGFE